MQNNMLLRFVIWTYGCENDITISEYLIFEYIMNMKSGGVGSHSGDLLYEMVKLDKGFFIFLL